jgi:uncharacterized protein YvpB
MGVNLRIKRIKQPPNECEPTCLKQVLDYFGISVSLDELIKKISTGKYRWHNWDFNTGTAAMNYGLSVTIYTTSTGIFDPTWFTLKRNKLIEKMKREAYYFKISKYSGLPSYIEDSLAALKYLEVGGNIVFKSITTELMKQALSQKHPLIAPLNYTLLRNTPRERYVKKSKEWIPDDVKGNSYGHVVVIDGFDESTFSVVDPWPKSKGRYPVDKVVVVDSILRNDSNLIELSR